VLARLLVVLLVELPDQLFEDRPHRVVIQGGQSLPAIGIRDGRRTQVDRGVEELLDEASQDVRVHELGDLVPEAELIEDLLHVGREAVQVGLEVGPELLGPRP